MSISWENKAQLAWNELIRYARDRSFVTYSDLGDLIDVHHRSVRYALDKIQQYCLNMRLPPLTILVVNSATGIPGTGFIAWDVNDAKAAYELVYAFNWETINNPFAGFSVRDTEDSFAECLASSPETALAIWQLVRNRGIAESIFRKALLKVYEGQCAMCRLSFHEALEAIHIRQWSDCTDQQRLDPRNGLLLCATHRKMVENNYFNIDKEFMIQYYDLSHSGEPPPSLDRAMTVELHGATLHLPKDSRLYPDLAPLRARFE